MRMKIPNWVVQNIGQEVEITRPFQGAVQLFPTGSIGRLESIQAGRRSPFATVELNDDICGGEENFQFSWLKPVRMTR